MIRFGSVCSGIEAASVAWHPLGWRAAWFAEVDRAASEVLAHRFPDVPNYGDMTLLAGMVRRREIEAPDVLVGGTPCQSFSVAGLRGGLQDARGQLTIAFIDLANAIDEIRIPDRMPPVIVVWENVPGILTHADNPLGCFLAGLAGDDEALEPGPRPDDGRSAAYWTWDKKARHHRAKWPNSGAACGPQRAVAWRILNAEFFGLAQRRRRVFAVASARPGFDPTGVLLEFEGVRRDTAPRREAGEGLTHPVAPCLTSSGRGVERTGDTRGQDAVVAVIDDGGRVRGAAGVGFAIPTWWDGRDVSQTLDAVLHKGQTMPEKNRFPAVLQPIAFSTKDYGGDAASEKDPTLRSMGHSGSHANGGGQIGVAYAFQPRIARNGRGDMGDCVNALTAQAGETGKGDAAPCVAYEVTPFDTTQITSPGNYSNPQPGDPCHPLAAGAHPPAVCVTGTVTHTLKAEGFDASEDGTGRGQPIVVHGTQDPCVGEIAFALGRNNGGENVILPATRMAVRRLMPVECERLQGFPDGWTDVPAGKSRKPAADGPRYKQLGNSMATNVMAWIGRRIAAQLGSNGGPPLDDEFEALLG
ncbi:DNA cytosine methyltransferase [Novosphingobium resinovorum]|uniref:DNA (cytosine-5-)-methyltransferase n=1 Tax=Novosphingobium resinovorum TaxID=158500 RepID=A0A1D8A344_9SPHN|nr:DNA cytosine methyltransferase [Novosphingobium resinovorum]AOR76514.1 hypothetical protein BES08_06985 [Novosphingobium resinovorum]